MNPNHALMPQWMFRWVNREANAAPSSVMSTRVEVTPPQLWPSSLTWHGRLLRWLDSSAPWVAEPQRPVNRLATVKDEFLHALADVDNPAADTLAGSIARARSLRELWHLRAPVYNVLAMARTQGEAEHRMGLLNRHFPTRTPRPLGAASH